MQLPQLARPIPNLQIITNNGTAASSLKAILSDTSAAVVAAQELHLLTEGVADLGTWAARHRWRAHIASALPGQGTSNQCCVGIFVREGSAGSVTVGTPVPGRAIAVEVDFGSATPSLSTPSTPSLAAGYAPTTSPSLPPSAPTPALSPFPSSSLATFRSATATEVTHACGISLTDEQALAFGSAPQLRWVRATDNGRRPISASARAAQGLNFVAYLFRDLSAIDDPRPPRPPPLPTHQLVNDILDSSNATLAVLADPSPATHWLRRCRASAANLLDALPVDDVGLRDLRDDAEQAQEAATAALSALKHANGDSWRDWAATDTAAGGSAAHAYIRGRDAWHPPAIRRRFNGRLSDRTDHIVAHHTDNWSEHWLTTPTTSSPALYTPTPPTVPSLPSPPNNSTQPIAPLNAAPIGPHTVSASGTFSSYAAPHSTFSPRSGSA